MILKLNANFCHVKQCVKIVFGFVKKKKKFYSADLHKKKFWGRFAVGAFQSKRRILTFLQFSFQHRLYSFHTPTLLNSTRFLHTNHATLALDYTLMRNTKVSLSLATSGTVATSQLNYCYHSYSHILLQCQWDCNWKIWVRDANSIIRKLLTSELPQNEPTNSIPTWNKSPNQRCTFCASNIQLQFHIPYFLIAFLFNPSRFFIAEFQAETLTVHFEMILSSMKQITKKKKKNEIHSVCGATLWVLWSGKSRRKRGQSFACEFRPTTNTILDFWRCTESEIDSRGKID